VSDVEPLLPVFEAPVLKPGPVFLCFEIQGEPHAKQRHRSRIIFPTDPRKKAFIHNYPHPETEAYEKMLKEYAALLMRKREPTLNPVALLVHAFRRVPESWSAKDKRAALMGGIVPTARPDGDNYLKAAQDALNGIVYRDDSQIVDARVIKRFNERPAMRIEVREFLIEGLAR
jgi:Holliday junction resolvase RusA-like endonuclease